MKKTTINIDEQLKKLGIDKLKDHQKAIINGFLRKRDVLGILPTGYGKSLCYILPHMIKSVNVIVISPLLSLMEDQYKKLVEKGVNCILFNSNHKLDMEVVSQIYRKEETYIMYFSPESLMINQDFVRALVKKRAVGLFAVDEAHCISMWSDFRQNYGSLDNLKQWQAKTKKKIPILALTATATTQIEEDIIGKLRLTDPLIVKMPVYKDNIAIHIHQKTRMDGDVGDMHNKLRDIGKKAIIYCKKIDETTWISSRLAKKGIRCAPFHSKLGKKQKMTTQEDFQKGKIRVLVATVAFGMGVDIRDIHIVMHYGLPKDIESYYQEIGRGGRDGGKVYCHMYWGRADQSTNQYFISTMYKSELRDKQLAKSHLMEKFVNSNECRMKGISEYFGCTMETKCKKCDNCTAKFRDTTFDQYLQSKKKTTSLSDIELRQILQTYKDASGGLGIITAMLILSGSKSKKLGRFYRSLDTYGVMKGTKQDEIKRKIRKVLYQDYLNIYNISDGKARYYKINDNGTSFLSASPMD